MIKGKIKEPNKRFTEDDIKMMIAETLLYEKVEEEFEEE